MKTPAAAVPPCPVCGGPMYDRRNGSRNPKAPIFKCKAQSCGHAIWPPKNGASTRVQTSATIPKLATPVAQLAQVTQKAAAGYVLTDAEQSSVAQYGSILETVVRVFAPVLASAPRNVDQQALCAMAATVFIQSRRGV